MVIALGYSVKNSENVHFMDRFLLILKSVRIDMP